MVQGSQSSRAQGLRRWKSLLRWLDERPAAIYVVLGVVAAVLYLINLDGAPDFTIDDTLYTLAGHNVAVHGSISWSAQPVYVHPPLFFLTVGGWLFALGKAHAATLDAEHTARYLNALFDIGLVLLSASLTRALSRRSGAYRAATMLAVGLLVATDPFLTKFGRSVLMEPMSVLVGMLVVRLAYAWRDRPAAFYVGALGAVEGLALLTKEVVVFPVLAPLLVALLQWSRPRAAREVGALVVAFVVFGSWVVAGSIQGQFGAISSTATLSLRRLLGLVQVTGVHRKGVSPFADVTQSLPQLAAGYLVLLAGGILLLVALWRVRRRLRSEEQQVWLIAFGLVCFVFVGYSLLFGAGEQQLTVYAVPASAILLALSFDEPRRGPRLIAPALRLGVAAVAIAVGAIGWVVYVGVNPHDAATSKVEAFLSTQVPLCAPVNSTGDEPRWSATLATHPVTAFQNGPLGVAAGVHVWLLSPKDSRFYYGSSPALEAWIKANGHQVFSTPSTSYQRLEVWEVGTPVTPAGLTAPSCSAIAVAHSRDASVGLFLLLLTLVLLLVAAVTSTLLSRRDP